MNDRWDDFIERIARTLSRLQDGDFEVYEYSDEPGVEGTAVGKSDERTSVLGRKHSRYGQCIYADPEKYETGGYIVEVGAKKYGGWFRDDGFPENPEALEANGFRRYSRRENWRAELATPEEAARALVLGMRDGRDCTELWRYWRATS